MPGVGSALDRNDHELIRTFSRQVSRLADEMERMNDRREQDSTPSATVDIQFTREGVSATVYGSENEVLDDSWFTWAEVEERKQIEASDITFEIGSE